MRESCVWDFGIGIILIPEFFPFPSEFHAAAAAAADVG
jgi:hypothetical protein